MKPYEILTAVSKEGAPNSQTPEVVRAAAEAGVFQVSAAVKDGGRKSYEITS